MSEIEDRISSLEKQKGDLIAKSREIDGRIRYKEMEAKVLHEVLKNEFGPDARKLRRELQILEFKVATEALNIQSERRFMKEIKEVEKELEKAMVIEKKRRKLSYVEGDIKVAEMEKAKTEEEIQRVKKEIEEAKAEARGERKQKGREERKKAEKEALAKEYADYMKPSEGDGEGVSLGEIAIIKKKG